MSKLITFPLAHFDRGSGKTKVSTACSGDGCHSELVLSALVKVRNVDVGGVHWNVVHLGGWVGLFEWVGGLRWVVWIEVDRVG